MSVKVRPYKKGRGGWEVDICLEMPDRTQVRERRKAPASSRSGAMRWGLAREREILLHGPAIPRKEIPTIGAFYPRFLDGYARANRQKPSGIAAKETVCRVYLDPFFGRKRLDAIGNEDVQRLKTQLGGKAPKTVNNILTVLNTLLRVAVEWRVVEHMPCRIRLVRVPDTEASFYDFDEYQRFLRATQKVSHQAFLIGLLAGEAGLRCGEIMALEWTDVDFARRQLRVQRSEWKGHVTTTKGGRSRCVPLTANLTAALRAHKHLRGPRVLCREDGMPLTQKMVRNLARKAAQRANLSRHGLHILRHTFCSHLAMRGAPTRAIQELAGHRNLSTTQRYMHLSPAAVEGAIKLLEKPAPVSRFGDILETGRG